MRLIGAASIVLTLALTFVIYGFAPATAASQLSGRSGDDAEHNQRDDGERRHRDGQAIFRYDTFGDEQLWTNVLRMHEVIATVPPATALALGLKVDVTVWGALAGVAITCGICRRAVDNSFPTGIGGRLDGWASADMNVGAIVALSAALGAATKGEFNAWGPGKYDPRHHAFDG